MEAGQVRAAGAGAAAGTQLMRSHAQCPLTPLLMFATQVVVGWPSRPLLCSSWVTRKGPACQRVAGSRKWQWGEWPARGSSPPRLLARDPLKLTQASKSC